MLHRVEMEMRECWAFRPLAGFRRHHLGTDLKKTQKLAKILSTKAAHARGWHRNSGTVLSADCATTRASTDKPVHRDEQASISQKILTAWPAPSASPAKYKIQIDIDPQSFLFNRRDLWVRAKLAWPSFQSQMTILFQSLDVSTWIV